MLTYRTRGFDYADGQAEENSTDGDWEGLHSPVCPVVGHGGRLGCLLEPLIWLSLWHSLAYAGPKGHMLLQ